VLGLYQILVNIETILLIKFIFEILSTLTKSLRSKWKQTLAVLLYDFLRHPYDTCFVI